MKKIIIVLLVFLHIASVGFSQSEEEKKEIAKKEKAEKKEAKKQKKLEPPTKGRVYFAPLPVIMVNPTFGFMYGVAASTSAYIGEPENTRLSTSLGSLTYTTLNQFMFTFKSNAYLSEDKWILMGDVRYFNTSQPTYGLGTGPQSSKLANGFEYKDGFFSETLPGAQMMEFQFFRFHETAFKEIKKYFYGGIGYHMDYHWAIKDNLLNLDTVPPTLTSHYLYSTEYDYNPEKYILSGLSLNLLYDSRDNAANTYKGMYALITYRFNPTWQG